jgi:GxxExxY protein
MAINDITGAVVESAIKVHSALGPGLLERAYPACLTHELRKRGLAVLTQLELPVIYDGIKIDLGYRVDLLVEGRVVVDGARLLGRLKDGITRMVN